MIKFKPDAFNSKKAITGLVVWLVMLFAGILYYFNAVSELERQLAEQLNELNKQGVSETLLLVEKNRRSFFDCLALNDCSKFVLITENLSKTKLFKSAAILVNKNTIAAHTKRTSVGRQLPVLKNKTDTITKEHVVIEEGLYLENEIIRFHSDIFIPERAEKLGNICLTFSKPVLNGALLKYKIALFLQSLLTFLAIAAIVIKTESESESEKKGIIGPYRIESELPEQGGMSQIFLAINRRSKNFQTTVVIKTVHPDLRNASAYIQLFNREARLAVQLASHPNIVTIIDFYPDKYALIMEYIEGKNLKTILTLLRKQHIRLPVNLVIFIISEAAKGLRYAHTKICRHTGLPLSIIHRDIKPDNILIS